MGFRPLKRLALGCVPHSAVPALPIQDNVLKENKCKLLVCTNQAVPPLWGNRIPTGGLRLLEGRVTKLQVPSGLYSAYLF